jgi:hypothetical protein
MPAVRKGEKRKSYVNRAIPKLLSEGLSVKQAVGKAEGMFTGKWKGQKRPAKKGK